MNQLKKNMVPYIFTAIAGIILVYSIVPYLMATWFVVPVADDLQLKPALGVDYFSYAFQHMASIYLRWQGTYISEFIYAFFSPFSRAGMGGLRLFCFISVLFFYFSLWIFVLCISKHLLRITEYWKILLSFAMISMLVSNAYLPRELFFWYTGICVYTVPLAFTLIGAALLVDICMHRRRGIGLAP